MSSIKSEEKIISDNKEIEKIDKIKSIKIEDFDMPFGSMVSFMIKWALASIPALMILFTIGIIMSVIIITIFGSIVMSLFTYS